MKRNKFSLSHYKLLTCDMGELVPVALTEVLPGDTMQQATSLLVRVSPLLAPVMHPVSVRIHHWFVPHRLVWEDFENFITGGPDGLDASIPPFTSIVGNTEGTLADYLGLPIIPGGSMNVSALPFRGYNLIWNEFYRDQDLQAELLVPTTSGADTVPSYDLQHVCWEKDYFTSSRPWTQKGPDVNVPFASTAPVISNNEPMRVFTTDGTPTYADALLKYGAVGSEGAIQITGAVPTGDSTGIGWGSTTGLVADLAAATAVNINDLREAFAIQRYQEARARYGSRYTEYLRYLGVRSSDARLQRPEYLGGGKQTIQFSEVLQTGPGDDGVVGDLKGHGIGAVRSNRYRRFFEEHGYVFSLMSVKPKTMYANGIARTWTRAVKEDFFQAELQHIGQQEVFNKEIFATHVQPDGIFGYQDRYDEYRRSESSIAGNFRTTLDHWHYARMFASAPALNADFVKSEPTKRVNAVQDQDVLWIMANHSIQSRRMVSASARSFIF